MFAVHQKARWRDCSPKPVSPWRRADCVGFTIFCADAGPPGGRPAGAGLCAWRGRHHGGGAGAAGAVHDGLVAFGGYRAGQPLVCLGFFYWNFDGTKWQNGSGIEDAEERERTVKAIDLVVDYHNRILTRSIYWPSAVPVDGGLWVCGRADGDERGGGAEEVGDFGFHGVF